MILHKDATPEYVFVAQSTYQNLQLAKLDLSKREGMLSVQNISYVDLKTGTSQSKNFWYYK